MKILLLAATLAAAPAAAQEFAAEMSAAGALIGQARIVKVKHAGRPPAPYIGRYDARHVRFELRRDVTAGSDEPVFLSKSIRILYKDALLATLEVYDMERGIGAAAELAKSLEDLRLRAAERGGLIAVDYAAIARQNETGAWRRRDGTESSRLAEIIRIETPSSGLNAAL